jgi:hypothetical protein
MNKKQEDRLKWMRENNLKLTFEEIDGILHLSNDFLILENGDFRLAREGGKGATSSYVIFTEYPSRNDGEVFEPPPQDKEYLKKFKS